MHLLCLMHSHCLNRWQILRINYHEKSDTQIINYRKPGVIFSFIYLSTYVPISFYVAILQHALSQPQGRSSFPYFHLHFDYLGTVQSLLRNESYHPLSPVSVQSYHFFLALHLAVGKNLERGIRIPLSAQDPSPLIKSLQGILGHPYLSPQPHFHAFFPVSLL